MSLRTLSTHIYKHFLFRSGFVKRFNLSNVDSLIELTLYYYSGYFNGTFNILTLYKVNSSA